jgi:protein TonB
VRTAVLGGVLVIASLLGAPLLQPWWSPPATPARDPLAGLPPDAFGPGRGPLPAEPVVPAAAQATIVPPATARPVAAMPPPVAAAPGSKVSARPATATRKPPARGGAPSSDTKRETGLAPLAATSLRTGTVALETAASSVPAPIAPAGPVFEVTQVDVKPQIEKSVPARYPASVREPAADVVVLRVLVGPGGMPSDVRVLRKSRVDPALDHAAVSAVQQWRFSPALRRSQPVSCWYSVGVQLTPSAEGSQ